MKIKPITPEGLIEIAFDQDMEYPETINQSDYKKVFVCSITSAIDGTTAYTKFED